MTQSDGDPVAEAITGYWGERCPDFDDCFCCKAWAAYDLRSPSVGDTAGLPSDHAGLVYRHKKRGSEYVLIGYGKMQAKGWYDPSKTITTANIDMREVAIYRSVDDGSLWVRPREEFEDGRFEAIAALSRTTEAVAWRWRYSNKGPWQYTENPPSSGLYDGCEFEPLYATPPAPQPTTCFECNGPLHGPYCPACRPQPALALIEELTGALDAHEAALKHLESYEPDMNPDRFRDIVDELYAQAEQLTASALASTKRFKEEAPQPIEPLTELDFVGEIGAEVRRRNRVGEADEKGAISPSCEHAAMMLVINALRATGFEVVRTGSPAPQPIGSDSPAPLPVDPGDWIDWHGRPAGLADDDTVEILASDGIADEFAVKNVRWSNPIKYRLPARPKSGSDQ